jgi:carbonic anhydrase
MELIYRYDPLRPLEFRRPKDAQAAIGALLSGNRRLVSFVRQMQEAMLEGPSAVAQARHVVPVDLLSLGLPFQPGFSHDQSPFACVLGCSDARVPIESVFDQSFNDLFVMRVAGNVLGVECVGSCDFAVKKLGESLKAVVVLGHTGCGAVSAAVDAYLSPEDYADTGFTHSLRTLVDRIMIAVRGTAKSFERRYGHAVQKHPDYRDALIEASSYLNAAITAFDLHREIAGFVENATPVYYGVCDLGSMLVRDVPALTSADGPRLAPAPQSSGEFTVMSDRLVEVLAVERPLAP